MKTVYQIIDEAKSCQHNGKIYLIETISEYSGIFTCNGDILYLVRNDEKCMPLSIMTEFLQMTTAVFVQSIDEKRSFPDAEYNILGYKSDCIDDHFDNVESFINLCVAHTNLLSGKSFEQFFYSLISLFQLPREQSYLNLEGLFAELSVLYNIYKTVGLDLSLFWHKGGPFSKYDITLPNRNSVEVKASSKGDKAVEIKHSQIFSVMQKVCLASVQVNEDNSGTTVEEIINLLRSYPTICNNLQFELSLQKELRRVPLEAVRSKRFIASSIHYFLNSEINPFPVFADNVEDLNYRLNISEYAPMTVHDLNEFLSEPS